MSSRVKKKLLSSAAVAPNIEPKAEPTKQLLPEGANSEQQWIDVPRQDQKSENAQEVEPRNSDPRRA